MDIRSCDLSGCNVSFLPIVSAFVKKIGVVEEVDRLCESQSDVNPGHMVLALILDTLSGRSPLYRLEQSFADMDLELLLGENITAAKLNDDAVGRCLDRIFDTGTGQILTAVALRAVKLFDIDTSHVHHDTTSVTLYGDYDLYGDDDPKQPFVITYGFSKDHRPDLKQLVHSVLCVDHGIPIHSKIENGNKSDKTINKDLLDLIVEKMREMGQDNPLYVADSALVTEDNLSLMSDEKKGCGFVTRLPMTYKQCGQAISRSVDMDQWEELGVLSQEVSSPQRQPAHYHGFETTVTLYGRSYRALVVHSSAYDRRKRGKLERLIKDDLKQLNNIKADMEKIEFACLPDAQAAVARLQRGRFHELTAQIEEIPKYPRGRPSVEGTRQPSEIRFRVNLSVSVNQEALTKAEKEAGCFVLITNEMDLKRIGSRKLLEIYKSQDTIEKNFGFLKDDQIVNALFLKTPSRIEALGLIFILSLLVWRLMERTMRVSLKQSKSTIRGWEKRQTSRPTSFIMSVKFHSVMVFRINSERFLMKPLSSVQKEYLKALGLSAEIFTKPFS